MPATLTAPITNRRRRASSRYPTLSDPTKQALWIDFTNQSKTDTNGLVAATAGDSIWTVKLPTGWGASSGDGLVRQNTSSKRPILRSDGVQSDGSNDVLVLPASIALSGNFTFYWVGTRGAAGRIQMAMGTNSGSGYENVGQDWSDNTCYNTDSGGSNATGGPSNNTYCIRRWRRSSGTSYYKAPSASEVSTSGGSASITVAAVLARIGQAPVLYTNTNCRLNQMVLVTANLTPGGSDDLAIIAALQSLCPGVSGP